MLLDVRPNCINWNIFSEISWGWGGGEDRAQGLSAETCACTRCLSSLGGSWSGRQEEPMPWLVQGVGVLTQHLLPLQPLPIPPRISH